MRADSVNLAGKGWPNFIVVIVVVDGLQGVGQARAAATCGGVAAAQLRVEVVWRRAAAAAL